VPPHVEVVSFFSFDQSSPVTTGPVPSPSIGSLIVTEPRAKLPMTAPRPLIVIVPRASLADSVPSFGASSQYRRFNCALHHCKVRKL
jgi:hypothetical protein